MITKIFFLEVILNHWIYYLIDSFNTFGALINTNAAYNINKYYIEYILVFINLNLVSTVLFNISLIQTNLTNSK
jgi:hypothetical protein